MNVLLLSHVAGTRLHLANPYHVLNQTNELHMSSSQLTDLLVNLVHVPHVNIIQWLEYVARMLHMSTYGITIMSPTQLFIITQFYF